MQLPNWLKLIFCKRIPRELPPTEFFIARCVLAPMHFKKDNLDSYCFIPPKLRTDVSLVRLAYCNPDCAKKDGVDIAKKITDLRKKQITFRGLALINNSIMNRIGEINGLHAKIKGTPINKKDEYVEPNVVVFKCDQGKPFHADLIYNEPVPDGEPATKHRQFADNILKQINDHQAYFEDPYPEDLRWCNPKLFQFLEKLLPSWS